MKEKTYKIKYGINMKNHAFGDPPLDIINKLAVNRANTSEYGPVDFFGEMKQNKFYTIDYDYQNETISIKGSKKRYKSKKKRNALSMNTCKPLLIHNHKYKWMSSTSGAGAGAAPITASSANVFGSTGVLQIHRKHVLQIPEVNALDCEQTLFHLFGILLVHPGEVLPRIKVPDQTLYMVSYKLKANFAATYVHANNGPGVFLEHHHFPHYIIPLSKDGHGPIVVGGFLENGSILLLGVNVPLGHVLYLPEKTIHNDWYYKGKLGTTVMVDDEADTVFLRGTHSKKIAMEFLEKPHA